MLRNPRIVTGGLCPEITVKADIGGLDIIFAEQLTNASPADLDERLDIAMRAINRQRAKVDLGLAQADLNSFTFELESLPATELAWVKTKVDEQARLKASFEAAHSAAGKRAEFRMNDAQGNAVKAITDEIASKRAAFATRKVHLELEIPLTQARIERCQQQVDGVAERHEVLAQKAAEAAD